MRAFVMGVVFLAGLAVGMAFRTGDASAQWSDQEPMHLLKDGGVVPLSRGSVTVCGNAPPVDGLVSWPKHRDQYDVCPRTMPIRVDAQGYVICSRDGGTP